MSSTYTRRHGPVESEGAMVRGDRTKRQTLVAWIVALGAMVVLVVGGMAVAEAVAGPDESTATSTVMDDSSEWTTYEWQFFGEVRQAAVDSGQPDDIYTTDGERKMLSELGYFSCQQIGEGYQPVRVAWALAEAEGERTGKEPSTFFTSTRQIVNSATFYLCP